MANNRKPQGIKIVTDPSTIAQAQYSDEAQIIRGSEAGLNWKPVGAISPAQRIGAAKSIMIYNASSSVIFVAFGDQNLAVPATPAQGLPVLPNSIAIYNSGLDQWVVASSAQAFAYIPEDYDPSSQN